MKNAGFFLGVGGDHRGVAVCLTERLPREVRGEVSGYAIRLFRWQRQPNPEWLESEVKGIMQAVRSEQVLVISRAADLSEWLARVDYKFTAAKAELEPSTALLAVMGAVNLSRVREIDPGSEKLLQNELKLLSENSESQPDLSVKSEALLYSLGECYGRDTIAKKSSGTGALTGPPLPEILKIQRMFGQKPEITRLRSQIPRRYH